MATTEWIDAPGRWWGTPNVALGSGDGPYETFTSSPRVQGAAGYLDIFTNGGLVGKAVPANADYLVQTLFQIGNSYPASDMGIIWLREAGAIHVDLRITPTGTIRVTRNGTSLGLGTTVLPLNAWIWIQMKVNIHDTTGTIEVHIYSPQTIELNLSGLDTRNAGSGVIDRIDWGAASADSANRRRHRYVRAVSGSDAAFTEELAIAYLEPNGAGNSTQWTPSAGANWQNVDDRDTAPDDDTTYNSEATNGNKDLYALVSAPSSIGSVLDIMETVRARKDDAGAQTLRRVLRTNATDYESGDIALTTSYLWYTGVRSVNPNTGVAWTEAEISALEVGVKKQA